MPSLSQLNVRLGLIYKDLDKGLEQVERKMRASGRRYSDLGDQLSLAISVPLAAAGAAAIKSAGDIESLQLALESQLGSAEAARKELELLRKEALKPGLGFEQAVRASVSLQAVGFNAEQARKITTEFGNALANAGKGAAELDGVVLALTQIQAKGVVSAEEINQIAERLPQIRTLMQAAFGTASSEAIQKLGISSRQFIEGITKELEKLPRATGGIKNSLENFFQGIQQGAAKFGFAISKAFDVPAKLDAFTAGLSSVADAFAALDPEVQKFIIGTAAAAVAAGPLIKVLGVLRLSGAQFIDVLQGGAAVLKNATGAVIGLTDAGNRLKLAFGIVGIVAGVTAAVFALSNQFDAAAYAQEKFEDGQRAVIESTAKEVAAVNQNFEALKKEGASRVEKGKIIDELLRQYPTYLRGIDLESASVSKLTEIQKGLNAQILRGVAERQKAQAITSLYEKQAQILLRIQQLRDGGQQTVSEATLVDTGDVLRAGSIAGAVIEKLQQQADELGRQVGVTASQFDKAFGTIGAAIDPTLQKEYEARDAYYAARDAQEDRVKSTENAVVATKKEAKATKEAKTELDLYLEKLSKTEEARSKIQRAAASLGLSPLDTLPQAGSGPVASNAPGALPQLATVAAGITQALTPAQALFQALSEKTLGFNEAFTLLAENVAANGTLMQQTLLGVANSVTAFAEGGGASLGGFVNALVDGAKKAVGAYIRMGVAAIVAKALASSAINPFAALAIGGIAGAAAQTLFNSLLSKVKIPAFASGTDFAPGGMALVGERGPELVNLPRGSQVIPNHRLDSLRGSATPVEVTGTLRAVGSELLVVLENAQRKRGRIGGY